MRPRRANDDGAMLLLAIIFVLVVGLVGGSMTVFASSALSQTSSLTGSREAMIAAESAINFAIDEVRLTGGTNAYFYNGNNACSFAVPVPGSGLSANVRVNCALGTVTQLGVRPITFSACAPAIGSSLTPTRAACSGATPVVSVKTVFFDLNKAGSDGVPCTGLNQTGCFNPGVSVTVKNWQVAAANA